jgi:membrane protease YdiL (CAAX protease family)
MSIKRLILSLLTILAVINLFVSLQESFSQPQIQSRLELYQTNLVLQALEFRPDSSLDSIDTKSGIPSSQSDRTASEKTLNSSFQKLIGDDPKRDAEKQYQKAKEEANVSLANLQTQIDNLNLISDRDARDNEEKKINRATIDRKLQLQQSSQEIKEFIDETDLKLGILAADRGQIEAAQKTWRNLIADREQKQTSQIDRQITQTLINLWNSSPQENSEIEIDRSKSTIETKLDGWFRYRVLKQLYQQQNRQNDLLALETREREIARQSLLKLFAIAIVPLIGGAIGVVLLIFLIAQSTIVKDKSLLAQNGELSWETPWDWETTWQVIIVGFFFIGQILLPFLFSIPGFNPVNLSLRYKAVYVLVSYLSMAAGGVLVLYLSIKSFFPLPKEWFRLQWRGNWLLWGLGGYTIALPLVVLVSLINQQIWNGQGGSNPLLSLALKSQDRVALAIFFITASIAAPIFEEFIFRGFLLPSLTRYISVTNAILLSSFIFAIAHLSISEVLPLTTLGIILGVVYTRSRNLLASMLLHSLWNSGTLISLFVLGSGVG